MYKNVVVPFRRCSPSVVKMEMFVSCKISVEIDAVQIPPGLNRALWRVSLEAKLSELFESRYSIFTGSRNSLVIEVRVSAIGEEDILKKSQRQRDELIVCLKLMDVTVHPFSVA